MPVKYVLQLFVPLVDPISGDESKIIAGDFDDTDSEFLTAQTPYGELSVPRVACHAMRFSSDLDFDDHLAAAPSIRRING
jgi:hypothetical protein